MSVKTGGVHHNDNPDQAPSAPESSGPAFGPAAFFLAPVNSHYPDIADGSAQTTCPPQLPHPPADLKSSRCSTSCPTPLGSSEHHSSPSSKISFDSHTEHPVSPELGLNTADTSAFRHQETESVPENSSGEWPPYRGYRERHKRKRDESDTGERHHSPAAPQAPSVLERQNHDLRGRLRTAWRYIQTLKEQSSALEAHCQAACHALETEQALRQDDRRLLDIRAQELQSAQAFLSKADVYSCAEIHHLVQSLNNEIFQTAALITDSVLAKEEGSPSTKVSVVEKLQGCYDDRILALLRSEDKDVQACVLQEVIQSVFANVAAESINSWDLDPVRDEMLQQLYNGMQTTNPAVSGRWRALTRAQNKYGFSDNPEVLHTRTITSKVTRILRFAGRRVPKEEFKSTFGKNVLDFTTLLTKVDRAIGEGVTSQDLSVYLPSPGSAFDTNTMIDENAENAAAESEVALSTKLGLRSTTIIADSDARAEVILGKASVLLYTTLAEM